MRQTVFNMECIEEFNRDVLEDGTSDSDMNVAIFQVEVDLFAYLFEVGKTYRFVLEEGPPDAS